MTDRVRLIDSITGEVLAEGVRGTTQYDRETMDCPVTRASAMTEDGVHVRVGFYLTVPTWYAVIQCAP